MTLRAAFVSVVPSPYQRDLFRALAERVDLSVFYLESAAPDSPWPEKPLASYERVMPGFWFPLGRARCHVNWPLPRFEAYDVVVLNSLMSLTAQWLMRVTLRTRPWIFWGERLGPRHAAWHRQLVAPLHRCRAIAAIGSVAQREYAARFPEPRHFCVPYHCDLDAFFDHTRVERVSSELIFLFCGQMIARKGLDVLLGAFAQLSGGRLMLVGREAELHEMLALVPQNTRERIEYAGFQPPEKLPAFFARADVFVLPSRYDGWGVVVNQAIGAGLPVICSDAVGAGYDLVEPEVNGVRFKAGDADHLADAMRRFLAEPELAERWGAASRAQAAEWSPERGAERWLDVFKQVLEL